MDELKTWARVPTEHHVPIRMTIIESSRSWARTATFRTWPVFWLAIFVACSVALSNVAILENQRFELALSRARELKALDTSENRFVLFVTCDTHKCVVLTWICSYVCSHSCMQDKSMSGSNGTILTKKEKTAYSNGSMAATTTTHTILIMIMAHSAQYYQGQALLFAMSLFSQLGFVGL